MLVPVRSPAWIQPSTFCESWLDMMVCMQSSSFRSIRAVRQELLTAGLWHRFITFFIVNRHHENISFLLQPGLKSPLSAAALLLLFFNVCRFCFLVIQIRFPLLLEQLVISENLFSLLWEVWKNKRSEKNIWHTYSKVNMRSTWYFQMVKSIQQIPEAKEE